MNENDVHNHRSKQDQPEGDETPDKQQQTTDDLEYGDDVKIMANEQSLGEVPEQSRRGWRHRDEVQEDVRAEDDEDEPEKNPRINRGDFHPRIVA